MNFDNSSLPKLYWKVSEKQKNLKHPFWQHWLGLNDLNHFWSRSTTRGFVTSFWLKVNWTQNDNKYGGDCDGDGEDRDEYYDDAYCDDEDDYYCNDEDDKDDDYCDDEDDEDDEEDADAEDDYCDDEDD